MPEIPIIRLLERHYVKAFHKAQLAKLSTTDKQLTS